MLQSGLCKCRQQPGSAEATAASGRAHGQQVGCTEDEWMDEYRDADTRGSRERNVFLARPGMAPEEEALIQVCTCTDCILGNLRVRKVP